jgi:Asp-tRNA(Asn)/Glu-tRNA(Gln) amidotransferase A subunit family amidase
MRPDMTILNELSLREASRSLMAGTMSSESLTRSCLERIGAREDDVQAWAYIDSELALQQARQRDREPSRGPLHGIPVGIKDVLDTFDMPTLWGDSETYAGRRPQRDAPIVRALRDAGAVLLGKTEVSRFGFWWPSKTRNPLALERTPGSSSSGSAAAVADRMCPLAVGTQTGGSIIRPAAFCGLAGIKPSHDWIAWRNARDFAPSFDVAGWLARDVADLQLAFQAVTGRAAYAPDGPLPAKTIVGIYRTDDWATPPPYVRDNFERTAARLADAGFMVREVALPAEYDTLSGAQHSIVQYETARLFDWELREVRDRLDEGVRDLVEGGLAVTQAQYNAAQDLGLRLRQRFDTDLGDVDVLMVPGSEGEPPPVHNCGSNIFIRMWMMLHVPDVSLPTGRGPGGLPLSVQLIGRRNEDSALLAHARRIEAALAA